MKKTKRRIEDCERKAPVCLSVCLSVCLYVSKNGIHVIINVDYVYCTIHGILWVL